MAEQDATTTTTDATGHTATAATRSAFPQFALDAADRQIEKVGSSLTGAADAIDEAFERGSLPGGDALQRYAGSAARRLRDLGERAGGLDADALVAEAQRAAAARPALAIAIGAAAGALLATVFVRMAPRAGQAGSARATATA